MKKHHQSDLSLSTIAEESGSYASNCAPVGGGGGCHDAYPMTSQSLNGANVVIEPHVVVETTTYPSTHVSKENNINIFEVLNCIANDDDAWLCDVMQKIICFSNIFFFLYDQFR